MAESPISTEAKTFGNCSKCNAPLPPGGGTCEYCGVTSRPPTKWEPGGKLHKMVQFGLDIDAQEAEEERRAAASNP